MRLARFSTACLEVERLESMSAERQERITSDGWEQMCRCAEQLELEGLKEDSRYLTLGPSHIIRFKFLEVSFVSLSTGTSAYCVESLYCLKFNVPYLHISCHTREHDTLRQRYSVNLANNGEGDLI